MQGSLGASENYVISWNWCGVIMCLVGGIMIGPGQGGRIMVFVPG